jgi:hypothetical protein
VTLLGSQLVEPDRLYCVLSDASAVIVAKPCNAQAPQQSKLKKSLQQ